jgi:4-amino-4-deoxy-L-arabinose transferase-like glycosyltransferase
LLSGLLAALLYRLLAVEIGFWAGLAAVIALFTSPRFFLRAQVALPEAAGAALMTAVLYLFWRNKESARLRYAPVLGVLYGLTLSADFHAVYLLPALLLWTLLFRPKLFLFIRLFLAGLIAIGIFFLFWPWLYYDTAARLTEFLQMQLSGGATGPFLLMGQSIKSLPWYYPFLLAWAVIPIGTMILLVAGIGRTAINRRARGIGSLFLLVLILPLGIFATGKLGAMNSDRILTPFLPFVAALCGMGFAWILQGIHLLLRRFHRPAIAAMVSLLLLILLFSLPVYRGIRLYPNLLAYYSEQVGGLAGIRQAGLETTYECSGFRAATDLLTQSALPSDAVWVDTGCTSVMAYYQSIGLLKDDIRIVPESESRSLDLAPDATTDYFLLPYPRILLWTSAAPTSDFGQWMSSHTSETRVETPDGVLLEIYTGD